MEERMSEKKNMTGKENSFHMENFRRRSRYAAVFLVLILAFAAITVLNINSGNVNISIPEIFRILLFNGKVLVEKENNETNSIAD